MKFKIGDKVKLNKKVKDFKHGRGNVGYDEIGEIIDIRGGLIYIDFPHCRDWKGVERELELVKKNKTFFKKLPNDYTGTLEVENGYIVEKEILDEEEKEYLSAVIKPFRDKIEYIEKHGVDKEYIDICIRNDSRITFPYFKSGTMYKGMELNKKYTLEELGL